MAKRSVDKRSWKHGLYRTPTYRSWVNMKHRCLNKRAANYKNYGGRGIKVCKHWLEFTGFVADMGMCPLGHTLERVDNDKGYNPDNCDWVPKVVNGRNKRTTVLNVDSVSLIKRDILNGKTDREIADHFGCRPQTINHVRSERTWKGIPAATLA